MICFRCNHADTTHLYNMKCQYNECGCMQMIFPEEPKKNGSPEFYALLQDMSDIHSKKSHDYAQVSNPFSNFERAGLIASWFTHPVEIAFACLIGIKLARLAELSTKSPKNESVVDTHLDLATYAALWGAWKKTQNTGVETRVFCPNTNCNHEAKLHTEKGCQTCECVIKNIQLFPGSIIPKTW